MKTRNFKVRIHNLTLKKNFFLEGDVEIHSLRIKYTKYMETLGYRYVRNASATPNVWLYTFYSKQHFKNRGEFNQSWGDYGSNRYKLIDARQKPVCTNPYVVLLEIVQLNHKHSPLKKRRKKVKNI